MPDPKKIQATIERAATLFRGTPGRTGSVVATDSADEVLVVGDLHGHLHTFSRVLKIADLDRNPARHLVLQELVHDPRVDPDAGQIDRSHRLVDLVCALKCQYPDRVHLILGNHELSEFTGRSISKKGFALNALFRQGVEADYGLDSTDALLAAYSTLFQALPLAIRTPNRVFLCHTIPDSRDLETLDLELLDSGVWPPESLLRGGTVYAMTWGRDTSAEAADRFASMVDADWFLIGHHRLEEGFRQANPRVIILDGTDPNPAYCLFSAREPVTIDRLLACVRLVPIPA